MSKVHILHVRLSGLAPAKRARLMSLSPLSNDCIDEAVIETNEVHKSVDNSTGGTLLVGYSVMIMMGVVMVRCL